MSPNSTYREVLFQLTDVARALRTYVDQCVRRHGMTRAQWGVLLRLDRREGMTQTEMADALMAGNGLKKKDIAHFVLHSAGRRVIEQVGRLMELDDARLAHSRRVLQQFGNMSSATVVFVLDDLLRSGEPAPGDWALMIALGPGFAAEGALLRW